MWRDQVSGAVEVDLQRMLAGQPVPLLETRAINDVVDMGPWLLTAMGASALTLWLASLTDKLPEGLDATQRTEQIFDIGFGEGRWASSAKVAFYALQQARLHDPKRKTGLYKNEADIALAARSFDSVVLSLDSKPGPLRDAQRQGGRIVFLNELQDAPHALGSAVERHLATPRRCLGAEKPRPSQRHLGHR